MNRDNYNLGVGGCCVRVCVHLKDEEHNYFLLKNCQTWIIFMSKTQLD